MITSSRFSPEVCWGLFSVFSLFVPPLLLPQPASMEIASMATRTRLSSLEKFFFILTSPFFFVPTHGMIHHPFQGTVSRGGLRARLYVNSKIISIDIYSFLRFVWKTYAQFTKFKGYVQQIIPVFYVHFVYTAGNFFVFHSLYLIKAGVMLSRIDTNVLK